MSDTETTGPMTYEAPETIRRMLFCTWALLNSLTHDQRLQATAGMDDERRIDWDFIPRPDRIGIPLFQMDRHQRTVAMTLLKSGLSMRGYSQVLSIMTNENILREAEAVSRGFGVIAGDFRDPEGYWFSFFGRPGFEDTWGWRVIGHHVGLSYTIVRQELLTVTPLILGQMPVPAGVLDPLGPNEEHAFGLLHSLNGERRHRAIIHSKAPADIVTRQVPRVGSVELPDYVDLGIPGYSIDDDDRLALRFEKAAPSGINGGALGDGELAAARELLLRWVESVPEEIADQYRREVEAEPPERITFAWAGGTDPHTSYYYRVSTSRLLVESDNAVAKGQHIHAIWRDLNNDLGHDLLLEHYAQYGHHGEYLQRRTISSEGRPDPAWEIQRARAAALEHDHHDPAVAHDHDDPALAHDHHDPAHTHAGDHQSPGGTDT